MRSDNHDFGIGAPSVTGDFPAEFGRYRILRPLGQGAMGTVYLAEDSQLGRQVALKVPQLTEGGGGRRLERFYREARLAATLHHPHICPIFDVGEYRGVHFISIALIQGRPLADVLQPGKPVADRTAAALLRKIALALHEAHLQGVIHRDLKPANIMIDQRGDPIVMDFGLASQSTASDEAHLTHTGVVIGTPAYMSPEQVGGAKKTVGPHSDIYALGVILFQMLTGRLPFEGPTLSVLAQVATQPAPRPSDIRREVSPQLEAICLKAMARNPSERYASMKELAVALVSTLRSGSPATEATRSVEQASTSPGIPRDTPAPRRETPSHGNAPLLNTVIQSVAPEPDKGALATASRDGKGWSLWFHRQPKSVRVVAGAGLVLLVLGMAARFLPSPGTPQGEPPQNLIAETAAERPSPDPQDDSGDGEMPSSGDEVDLPPTMTSDGYRVLFDGRTLAGWRVFPEMRGDWRVADGNLTGSADAWSYLYSARDDYEDFHLRAQVRISDVGSGAVALRSALGPAWPRTEPLQPLGYGVLIHHTGTGSQRTGSLFAGAIDPVVPVRECSLVPGTWFTLEVLVRGNRVEVRADDALLSEYDDSRQMFGRGRVALGVAPQSLVEFRAVEMRELDPQPTANVSQSDGLVVLRNFPKHVWGVALSADGSQALVAGQDATVRQFDAATGHEIRKLFSGTYESAMAAYSNDGEWMASCALVGTVFLWEVASGREVQRLDVPGDRIHCLAFSPDGNLLAAGTQSGQKVHVWDTETGEPVAVFGEHRGLVSSVALHPDGRRAASGGWDNTIRVWDVRNGQQLQTIKENVPWALHPGGQWLVLGKRSGECRLWNLERQTGERVLTTQGSGPVHALACSPDGKLIAVSRDHARIQMCDLESGAVMQELPGSESGVVINRLAFSATGRRLIGGGLDRAVRIWTLPEELVGVVPPRTPRPNNQQAAQQFQKLGGTVGVRHHGRLQEYPPGRALPAGRLVLEALTLHDKPLAPDDLEALGELSRLRRLDLNGCSTGSAGWGELRALHELRELSLWNARVTDRNLQDLGTLFRLERLELFANPGVTNAGLEQVRRLGSLRQLDLNATGITAAGLVHLATLTSLESLNLMNLRLSDDAMQHLGSLTNLKTLLLHHSGIGDEGLVHLTGLTRLEALGLDGTRLTDASIDTLAGFRRLKVLQLLRTQISEAGVVRLQEALPGAKVGWSPASP
ncbi:MAG: protein kinase domain-containing protein [Planctomycetales bacterium]